jgi:dihydroneopterin aldolase
MDKITLKNMKFYGYHGVLPEEQEKGQNFFIDLIMHCDVAEAGLSDNLEMTIDYSKVFDKIKEIVEKRKFKLIEKLASVIAQEMLAEFDKINSVVEKVRKPEAPIDGKLDWAEVEIVRQRDEL